jgi:catechol 2,3-dioxygenase-like lactoylglutathione lyase family enzyme
VARQGKRNAAVAKLIPSLGVSDIDRSVGFYGEFFGFRVVDSYEVEGHMAWCWLQSNGADLMLQQLSGDQQITLNPAIGQSWCIYIRPDDLPVLHARLTKAGFPVSEIARTSYGASEFFLSDPDGYELWISVPAANGEDDDEDEDEEDENDGDDEDYDDEDDDEEEEEWKVRH